MKNIRRKINIIISILLIINGLLINILIVNKPIIKELKEPNIEYYNNLNNQNKKSDTYQKKEISKSYFAIISIPKINLTKELPHPNGKENNVDKNIEVLKPYKTPNKTGTNLILASHSGTSKVSYFNNIKELTNDDDIYIYYKNRKYHYKVIKKYEVIKNGKLNIITSSNETLLTMTTCSTNKNKQLVIIAKQLNIN